MRVNSATNPIIEKVRRALEQIEPFFTGETIAAYLYNNIFKTPHILLDETKITLIQ